MLASIRGLPKPTISEITLFARTTINHYYQVEGGTCVVNDPDDLGGLTGPGGITEDLLMSYKWLWPKYGFTGQIAKVPYALSEEIFYLEFWLGMGLHHIEKLSPNLADTMFGWGINSGSSYPVRIMQQHINAMNKAQLLYPNMVADGKFGDTTYERLVDYLKAFAKLEGEAKLVDIIMSCQAAHYLSITTSRKEEKNEKWYNGWLNRVMAKRKRIFG